MMLCCRKSNWFIEENDHIPTGLIVSVLILLELLVVVGGWKYKDVMSSNTLIIDVSNTHQLGLVMYTDYILYFNWQILCSFSNDWRNPSYF